MDFLVYGGFMLLVVLAFYLVYRYFGYLESRKNLLHTEYLEALESGDKSKALNAGRRYYAHVRGGNLSIYDEQAIANDLSIMKPHD
ncbi:hypothetical protein [Taibaiella soli]|uniref:Uncharacterized protein n=1 Tax=Taibaiella soli TaxID=1649169 RepID=A0A2W2B0Q9_9BACT|nr:hypothetical protein [Taibaiella soli]PZF73568.1 hypothetical protein DN068_07550 [Taibaiella soli]